MRSRATAPVPAVSLDAPSRWDLSSILPWLFAGYILLLPVGEFILAHNHELPHDRARFHIVNAITLTGFQNIKPINALSTPSQITVFACMYLGMLFVLVVGGLCAARILQLPQSDRQIVGFACISALVLIILGMILLVGVGHRPPGNAFLLSSSAYGNSGQFYEPPADADAPHQRLPELRGPEMGYVLLPLAFIGSLGVPVLLDLWELIRRGRPLSFHSGVVLRFSAGLYLVFFAALALIYYFHYQNVSFEQGKELLATSSVESLNARSFGLPVQYAQNLPSVIAWALIPAMLIGGSPASTAGGLKTTTVYQLFRGARQLLRGQDPGKIMGIALLWTGLYFAIALLAFFLMIVFAPELRVERVAFDTASALSNCGLSFYHIQTVGPALDTLSATMLFGRLCPLFILWYQARHATPGDLALA